MATHCDTCGSAPGEIRDPNSGRVLCVACAVNAMTAPLWAIHHGSREYAANCGDPVLGYVRASSKDEAERNAAHMATGAGVWACEVEPLRGGGY